MLIGYARVSTEKQSLNRQRDALKKEGCKKIYTDKISGAKSKREGFDKLLEHAREGDTVVVASLDRLGRSMRDLIATANILKDRGIELRSLKENIDTSTPTGKFTFHLFAGLSELELSWIKERTKAGLESARARGRVGGRPNRLSTEERKRLIEVHKTRTDLSIAEVCKMFSISKGTLYNYLSKR